MIFLMRNILISAKNVNTYLTLHMQVNLCLSLNEVKNIIKFKLNMNYPGKYELKIQSFKCHAEVRPRGKKYAGRCTQF